MLSLQLKYFESAAQTENFSKTAHLFGVPTSTVSASIKKLETNLGVALFARTANKIKLNECGKILLRAVRISQESFKKARLEIGEYSGVSAGEVHLLILANRQKVTDVIYNFKRLYPEVSFTIKHTFPDKVSELKNYDVIVGGDSIISENFEKKFWFREDVMLAVHKDNPLCTKETVTIEELQSQKFICMHKGSSIRNYTDSFFARKGIKADISIECDDPKYLAGYLGMNLGVVMLPIVAMSEFVGDNIKLIKIGQGLHRDTCIYTNKSNSGIVNKFSQMLSEA